MSRMLLLFIFIFSTPVFSQTGQGKFNVVDDVIFYDTETNIDSDHDLVEVEDVDEFRDLLMKHPNIKQVTLNSGGGGYYAGFDMADLIIDFDLKTHVQGECISSCVLIFLGGSVRTMEKGSRIGFHNNSWSANSIKDYYERKNQSKGWDTPFEMASWLYQDTQEEVFNELEFFIERGVDPKFAIQSIRDRGDEIWYPRRRELMRARVLREFDKLGDCDGVLDCLLPARKH